VRWAGETPRASVPRRVVSVEGAPVADHSAGCHVVSSHARKGDLPIHPAFQPVVALVAGICILLRPRLLNYIVAIYLIVIGILGLLHRSL
jgi:hypothetical protein